MFVKAAVKCQDDGLNQFPRKVKVFRGSEEEK